MLEIGLTIHRDKLQDMVARGAVFRIVRRWWTNGLIVARR
jgi:hypothetical protein